MPCAPAKGVHHSDADADCREGGLSHLGGPLPGVVDTHTHVISPDQVRYPLAPVGGKQSDWSAHHPTDHDTLLRSMDDAGIERAMVVQASTAYGNDNRYAADAVRAHPNHFG